MKTLWCKNQENPSHRISHAWAPLKPSVFCAAFPCREFFQELWVKCRLLIYSKPPDFWKAIGFFLCRTPFIAKNVDANFGFSKCTVHKKTWKEGNPQKRKFCSNQSLLLFSQLFWPFFEKSNWILNFERMFSLQPIRIAQVWKILLRSFYTCTTILHEMSLEMKE